MGYQSDSQDTCMLKGKAVNKVEKGVKEEEGEEEEEGEKTKEEEEKE